MTLHERTLQNKAYTIILETVSIIAGIFIIVAFILYLTNLFTPFVSIDKLQEFWDKSPRVLIKEYNYPIHWDWILELNHIDLLCLFGLFLLILSNITSYMIVLPIYIIKKKFTYTLLVIIQLLIFIYAAFSNIISI